MNAVIERHFSIRELYVNPSARSQEPFTPIYHPLLLN